MMKIDIVLPWVNGEDRSWLEKKNQYRIKNDDEIEGEETLEELNGVEKYRDSGTLKYVLRSIFKFAPWVNHIYLITDHQIPDWINVKYPLITIVNHEDFIPTQWLPTFSSNAIILNSFRIKNLSEHFILFNDDMILNDQVEPGNFFTKKGLPVDIGIYSVIPSFEDFSHMILNNTIVINKYFNKWSGIRANFFSFFNVKYGRSLLRSFLALPWHGITGFYNPHMPISYLKSSFEIVWEYEEKWLSETSSHKFRASSDLTDWVVRYWQLQSGKFKAGSINFGKYYLQTQTHEIIKDLNDSKHKIICINDTPMTKNGEIDTKIKYALESKFDFKSKFEK
ncbi:Stealth CR1 domain-containing protein [Paucilactobacillus kaifaensis]|uniref:Stealth CR1 domain-containing protein n=1 Tax=Paucilactobacillus kaifaensis TaxID=2559921 RepID=UPI001CC43933|nr:Stealth CR1 domain-containing protein [Paucilactobacillus kaifaensis]